MFRTYIEIFRHLLKLLILATKIAKAIEHFMYRACLICPYRIGMGENL